MSEQDFWYLIKRNLANRPGHQFTRVENSCQADGPDVEYCMLSATGWIELKFIAPRDIPKRVTTVLRVDHYTDGQRLWHRVRAACGGRVWVFLRAADEFFLFYGRAAADHLGVDWTIQDCRDNAAGYWSGKVDWAALAKVLKQPTKMMQDLKQA